MDTTELYPTLDIKQTQKDSEKIVGNFQTAFHVTKRYTIYRL